MGSDGHPHVTPAAVPVRLLGRRLSRKPCRAELDLYGETYRCDRRKGHDGRHSERMYGADGAGQFVARVEWRQVRDRRA